MPVNAMYLLGTVGEKWHRKLKLGSQLLLEIVGVFLHKYTSNGMPSHHAKDPKRQQFYSLLPMKTKQKKHTQIVIQCIAFSEKRQRNSWAKIPQLWEKGKFLP